MAYIWFANQKHTRVCVSIIALDSITTALCTLASFSCHLLPTSERSTLKSTINADCRVFKKFPCLSIVKTFVKTELTSAQRAGNC